MTSDRYTFTREQLQQNFAKTIALFLEYRDQPGHDAAEAGNRAIADVLDSLNPDLDSLTTGGCSGPSPKSSEMGAVEDS